MKSFFRIQVFNIANVYVGCGGVYLEACGCGRHIYCVSMTLHMTETDRYRYCIYLHVSCDMGSVTGAVCFMTWLTCDMGGVTGPVCFMTWLSCDMGGVTGTVCFMTWLSCVM